eukprot:scaffold417629_cov22-Prasinocladus_malaysianus.AAC.1
MRASNVKLVALQKPDSILATVVTNIPYVYILVDETADKCQLNNAIRMLSLPTARSCALS